MLSIINFDNNKTIKFIILLIIFRDGRAGRRENLCDFLNYIPVPRIIKFILIITKLFINLIVVEPLIKNFKTRCIISIVTSRNHLSLIMFAQIHN